MLASYCSNLHAAESLFELTAKLVPAARRIRQILGWSELGLDLRLGSRAIGEALRVPASLDTLRQALDKARLRVTSFNAFPLVPFQVDGLKDRVYRPDWSDESRLRDTVALLRIAARLCDDRIITMGTVPCGYRAHGSAPKRQALMAAALGRWAAAACRQRRDGGAEVLLGLEPEPDCLIECAADWERFHAEHLTTTAVDAAAEVLDGDADAARGAVDRHLGICHDTCHASVLFADQEDTVRRCAGLGAGVVKCHFSAAIAVEGPASPAAIAALRGLAEPRFLHQTVCRTAAGQLLRIPDLDALDELPLAAADTVGLRSHFHVPIDGSGDLPDVLDDTVADSRIGLHAARRNGCRAVSVETYTWSTLARSAADPLVGTARELTRLQDELSAEG